MAVDRGYGSGKPLTAAQSRGRRRVAAGQLSKSKKGIGSKIKANNAKLAASPLGQAADFLLGFALPVGKVKAAAMGLRAAGKVSQAAALEARIAAKVGGKMDPAEVQDLQYTAEWGPVMKAARRVRLMSENVFPKTGNYTFASTFNRYGDMLPKATRKARGIRRVNPQAD
jgi:hypothetical protein